MSKKPVEYNNCDYGHDTIQEIRVLPISGGELGSNALLCRACFHKEIIWRIDRNKDLTESARFSLPNWDDLKVYRYAVLSPCMARNSN
jgi:hypothetical protein